MSEFERTVNELVDELRERLIRDAQARAVGAQIRGGVRHTWAEMVALLAPLVRPGRMRGDDDRPPARNLWPDRVGNARGREAGPWHSR